MILSMVVFMLALGAAFATSSKSMLMTEVWRKPSSGGSCAATTCLLQAPNSCAETGFVYYNNSACIGTTVSPKRN